MRHLERYLTEQLDAPQSEVQKRGDQTWFQPAPTADGVHRHVEPLFPRPISPSFRVLVLA